MPHSIRGSTGGLLVLAVLLSGITSCVFPPSDPIGSDGLTDTQWEILRRNIPLFYDAIGAVATMLAAEEAQTARETNTFPESCPQIALDPSGVANAYILTYGENCTLNGSFRTPIRGTISVAFGVRSYEVDLTYDQLTLDGHTLTGTAGLALSKPDEETEQITGNFLVSFVGHDEVRGIVTLEHHADGRLVIRNGFWLFEQTGVEFEVTDPTSNAPNSQIVVEPSTSTRLVPKAGRVAFRAAESRYVVTFNENTPTTGIVNVVIDEGATLSTTLPTRSLMSDD